MYCLVEKPLLKISTSLLDDWILRNRAAQLLCHIDRYCIRRGDPHEPVQREWTIPQLDKVLNWKTILAQLERAS